MNKLTDLLLLKFFDESKDKIKKDSLTTNIILGASMIIAAIGIAVIFIEMLMGLPSKIGFAMMIFGFTILSVAAWHKGLEGRAKNSIVLSVVSVILFVVVFS